MDYNDILQTLHIRGPAVCRNEEERIVQHKAFKRERWTWVLILSVCSGKLLISCPLVVTKVKQERCQTLYFFASRGAKLEGANLGLFVLKCFFSLKGGKNKRERNIVEYQFFDLFKSWYPTCFVTNQLQLPPTWLIPRFFLSWKIFIFDVITAWTGGVFLTFLVFEAAFRVCARNPHFSSKNSLFFGIIKPGGDFASPTSSKFKLWWCGLRINCHFFNPVIDNYRY